MRKTIRKPAVGKNAAGKTTLLKKTNLKSEIASLKKSYLKSGNKCKVTFRLPKQAALKAETVAIVGDFNNWSLSENRMIKLKSGDFKATLDLSCDREYRFRYLIDSNRWENDWKADKYIPNAFGDDDSVVVV